MIKIGNLEVFGVIYKITNIKTNESYIGQTTKGFRSRYKCSHVVSDIESVYRMHKRKGKRGNKHLLRSIEIYGFENFNITYILDVAFSQAELDIKEEVFIKKYNSYKNGFNQTLGGSKGTKGYSPTKECCKKIGEKLKGEKNGFYGRKHIPQSKKDISQNRPYYNKNGELAKPLTEELVFEIKEDMLNKPLKEVEEKYGYSDLRRIYYCVSWEWVHSDINWKLNEIRNLKEKKKQYVIYLYENGLSFEDISMCGFGDVRAVKSALGITPNGKRIRNKNALEERKNIILNAYYKDNLRVCDIVRNYKLTKSVVEKTISKYKKSIGN